MIFSGSKRRVPAVDDGGLVQREQVVAGDIGEPGVDL